MLYLTLFHGRRDPNQQMEDWGELGPTFGPLRYWQTTYLTHQRGELVDSGELVDLALVDDMLYYDGVYYGDWSLFAEPDPSKVTVTPFDETKAKPPKEAPSAAPIEGVSRVELAIYCRPSEATDAVVHLERMVDAMRESHPVIVDRLHREPVLRVDAVIREALEEVGLLPAPTP